MRVDFTIYSESSLDSYTRDVIRADIRRLYRTRPDLPLLYCKCGKIVCLPTQEETEDSMAMKILCGDQYCPGGFRYTLSKFIRHVDVLCPECVGGYRDKLVHTIIPTSIPYFPSNSVL